MKDSSALANWRPEQIALGKKWVATWERAAIELERIRRKELRELDPYKGYPTPLWAKRLHSPTIRT